MSNTHISEEPDVDKRYVCYFCEEEVSFRLPSAELMEVLFDKGVGVTPSWRHTSTLKVVCETVATPSNIEVLG